MKKLRWLGPSGDMVSSADTITVYDSNGRGLRLPGGSFVNWSRNTVQCGEHEAPFPGTLDDIPPHRLEELVRAVPGCHWLGGSPNSSL